MNSEKVKDIKKALKYNIKLGLSYEDDKKPCKVWLADILTLINELERENERLNKSDTSKEESSIEYYNLYKDLKRKNKDLNELCELQRVSISENFVKENQLKDRIAELEKENKELLKENEGCYGSYRCAIDKIGELSAERYIKVEEFGKWLKKKFYYEGRICRYIIDSDVFNESLKEFINE